jgi:ATP-dependent RNA helicase RhlE
MLDMGFLPSLRTILNEVPARRQTMLFSATIEPSVAHLIDTYVNEPLRIEVGIATKPAEQVDLFCYEIEERSKFDLLVHLLKQEKGSFLVFTRTKEGADRLAKFLEREKYKVACIHGDRSQRERNEALQGFKDAAYRVLVATDVAARGIHVDDIAHVVNYDLPQEPEGFIHRVGRTGRAGARGASWTFAVPLERSDVRNIERMLGVQVQYCEVPSLPRPIGLISDVASFMTTASMGSSAPVDNAPARPFTRSFSSGRRRSGRR